MKFLRTTLVTALSIGGAAALGACGSDDAQLGSERVGTGGSGGTDPGAGTGSTHSGGATPNPDEPLPGVVSATPGWQASSPEYDGVAVGGDAPALNGFDPHLAADGLGGVIVVWRAKEGATNKIMAQRVAPDGTLAWGTGISVLEADYNQLHPKVVSDGNGGAFITWQDSRNASPYESVAQYLNAAGERQWAASGSVVQRGTHQELFPDGSGGAWLLCAKSGRPALQRLTSQGPGEVQVAGGASGADYVWGSPTEDGNVAVGWFSSTNHIYMQRLGTSASAAVEVTPRISVADSVAFAAGPSSLFAAVAPYLDSVYGGLELFGASDGGMVEWSEYARGTEPRGNELKPGIVPQSDGGAIVVWEDSRYGSDTNIYGQRFDAAGNRVWEDAGRPLVDSLGAQLTPSLLPDGSGGTFIVWTDLRAQQMDVFVTRVDANGAVAMDPPELQVTSASAQQIARDWDFDGEHLFVVWTHRTVSANDEPAIMVVQRIDLGSQ
jgi:hypothetical protein